jgi:hypothetical protein
MDDEFDICESTWLYKEPIDGDELVEVRFIVLNSIEETCQVDSVYTDFLKAFDRVRHQLLLEEMFVAIETHQYMPHQNCLSEKN